MNQQKIIIVNVLFFVICCNLFSQQTTQYVKVEQENLRSEPNGLRLGKLNAGTKCEVLEQKSKWVKVRITGWIWNESLTSDKTMVNGYTIQASHILLNSRKTAQEVLTKIQQGASFEELARNYSVDTSSGRNGGDIGVFRRGDLNSEFEKAAFNLEVGKISEIVETNLGYHIIKRTK